MDQKHKNQDKTLNKKEMAMTIALLVECTKRVRGAQGVIRNKRNHEQSHLAQDEVVLAEYGSELLFLFIVVITVFGMSEKLLFQLADNKRKIMYEPKKLPPDTKKPSIEQLSVVLKHRKEDEDDLLDKEIMDDDEHDDDIELNSETQKIQVDKTNKKTSSWKMNALLGIGGLALFSILALNVALMFQGFNVTHPGSWLIGLLFVGFISIAAYMSKNALFDQMTTGGFHLFYTSSQKSYKALHLLKVVSLVVGCCVGFMLFDHVHSLMSALGMAQQTWALAYFSVVVVGVAFLSMAMFYRGCSQLFNDAVQVMALRQLVVEDEGVLESDKDDQTLTSKKEGMEQKLDDKINIFKKRVAQLKYKTGLAHFLIPLAVGVSLMISGFNLINSHVGGLSSSASLMFAAAITLFVAAIAHVALGTYYQHQLRQYKLEAMEGDKRSTKFATYLKGFFRGLSSTVPLVTGVFVYFVVLSSDLLDNFVIHEPVAALMFAVVSMLAVTAFSGKASNIPQLKMGVFNQADMNDIVGEIKENHEYHQDQVLKNIEDQKPNIDEMKSCDHDLEDDSTKGHGMGHG